MIERSRYLPKQMNGSVVCSVMAEMEKRLSDADAIESYLHDLSIATAQETELENIGRLVGYPRPLVPEGFNEENLLLLTALPHYQERSIGLSAVGSEVGGRLSSVKGGNTGYMELNQYRSFLDKVAYIKRYGITLYAVDSIAKLIDSEYTISWQEQTDESAFRGDIILYFPHSIGYKNVYLLTQLFYRLCTQPMVHVISEN